MIRMKRFGVLICALEIICVLGKSKLIDNGSNNAVNDAKYILPFEPRQYAISRGITDSYPDTSTGIIEFLDETTTGRLSNDYPRDHAARGSNSETTIDDFDELYENVITSSGEAQINDNELENELSACNTTDPRGVQNLMIKTVSTEWILLSWQAPCENLTDETFFYSVDVCSGEYCFQRNGTDTQLNVTDLNPCSGYEFNVTVVGENWRSSEAVARGSTSYNITEIGDIRGPGVHTTTNTITLTWDAPANYSMCVSSYLITQCFKDMCKNVRTTHTKYIAEDLEPCEKYFFTIQSIASSVQSQGFNITLKTNAPKPTEPQRATVEASAFSLSIRWEAPKVGATCVKHYHVKIGSEETPKKVTGTNVTINNLFACTSYSIKVNAVDEDNSEGEVVTIPAKTAPTVSRPPILNIKDPIVTTTEIMLPWKIEKGSSNCNLTSLKALCNFTASNGHGYEVTNGHTEVPINSYIQDEFLIVNSMIKNVSPFTSYICWAYVINEAGNSELSELIHTTTKEDIPSAPPLNVVNITYKQFVFMWESPKYLAGNLHEFEIVFEEEIHFPVPDWCQTKPLETTIYLNGSTFIFNYMNAKAYTSYKAKIRARTIAGWGNYSSYLIFRTPAGVPGIVSNFSYIISNNEKNTNILDTVLTWALPCFLNGVLEYFNVFVNGIRTNYPPHSFTIKKYISSDICNNAVSINLKELQAEYNYTINVSAKVEGVQEFGVPATQHFAYPAGRCHFLAIEVGWLTSYDSNVYVLVPPQPDEDYIKSITVDPAKARKSTTTATLLLPLFPNTNGDIVYYSIIVSKMEYNIPSSTRFDITNHTWPNVSSWEEAMLQDFMIPYQATRLWWDPYPNHVADYGDVKAVKYTLGEDINCEEISSNTNKKVYCNGPLKPNTWYHVRMRAFTHGGYSDSTTFLIKTNAEINIGLVTGVVFGILLLGILTTLMLLVRNCSPQVILRRFLHSEMSGSPVPAAFSKKKFINHCQQLIDNPGKLSNEFQLLQTLSVDLQMPTNTACLQANKKKNRYSDILPYDFSRVKLDVIDNDPNTDYINASFIKGYTGTDEYIACQGPKEETTFDFWRMVEQYNVNVIVMLTELVEKGKEKCHQYFPTIRETFKYEDMTIKCVSELDYRSYTQRTLILQKENKRRSIMHLHFKEWPDHDVPEDFDPMIHFCQVMRRNIVANKGYVVIHCSAGIGRTGTLIAIDILLQHLRDNRKLDVFGTVYRLRHHRINMVQKESQYAYIYNCIKQVLKNPYCLKSYKPPPVDPLHRSTSNRTRVIPTSNLNLVNSFEMCM